MNFIPNFIKRMSDEQIKKYVEHMLELQNLRSIASTHLDPYLFELQNRGISGFPAPGEVQSSLQSENPVIPGYIPTGQTPGTHILQNFPTLRGGSASPPPPSGPPIIPISNLPPTGGGLNPYRKLPFDEFQDILLSRLAGTLGTDYEITHRRVDDALRLSIVPKETIPGRKSSALVMDLTPGYNTPFGGTIELAALSGWRGIFGPEIYVNELERQGGMEIRSPVEAFSEYVRAAYSQDMATRHPMSSPMERFEMAYSLGPKATSAHVVGGMEWYGPVHPIYAQARMANRISVGINPDIKNYQDVLASIYHQVRYARTNQNQMVGAGQLPSSVPNETQLWAKVFGAVPIESTLGRIRMTFLGAEEPGDNLRVIGKDPADALKRRRIMPEVRERATMIQLDQAGRPIIAMPEPISATDMSYKGRAGFRLLGGSLPGSTERFAGMVIPHTAVTTSDVLSGTATMYTDPLAQQGIVSAGYQTNINPPIPQLSMYQLEKATWEFGHFREIKDKEGKVSYQSIGEKGKLPAALAPNETAIIGLLKYFQEGQEVVEPIRYSSPGRATFFTGDPELYIADYISKSSGKGVSGLYEGPTEPTDIAPNVLASDIQARFPGRVYAKTMGETVLQIPVHTQTGISGKGIYKSLFMPASQPWTTRPWSAINQRVNIPLDPQTTVERQIYAVTGTQKLQDLAFAGHFLSMTPKQQETMLGEFRSLSPALAEELQKYAVAQHAKTETVNYRGQEITTYGGLSSEVMGQMYAEAMNEPYQWETSATKMFAHLRQTVEALPVREQLQKYEYVGLLPRQPYYRGLVSQSEKRGYERSLFSGTYLALQKQGIDITTPEGQKAFNAIYPGGFPQLKRDVMQFEPVQLETSTKTGPNFDLQAYLQAKRDQPPEGFDPDEWNEIIDAIGATGQLPKEKMFRMSVAAPAQLTTYVSALVPEHLGRIPHIGYEEQAGIYSAAPEIANYLGLGPEIQGGPGATGMVPRHAAAWRQVGEIARYRASDTGTRVLPAKYQTVTPELAAQILGSTETDLMKMQEMFTEEGPLYFPDQDILWEKPETIEAISTYGFDEDQQTKMALSRWSRAYPNALRDLAGGETAETSSAIRNVMGLSRSVFMSNTASVAKTLQSRFVPGATTGRYSAFTGAGWDVGYINRQQLEASLVEMARARDINPYGMITNPINNQEISWLNLAKQQIAERGFTMGIHTRYPGVMEKGGSMVMPFVTDEILAQQGISFPQSTIVRGNKILPGSPFTSGWTGFFGGGTKQTIGDWDGDPNTLIQYAMADPVLGLIPYETQAQKENIMKSAAQKRKEIDAYMMGSFGGNAFAPGGEYDVVAKELGETAMSVITGKHGREATAPGIQPKQMAVVSYDDLMQEAELELYGGTGGSGKAYRVRQLTESAATALGMDPRNISEMKTAQAWFYQTYIDVKTGIVKERGGPRAIETLFNSAFFGTNQLGQYNLVAKNTARGNFTRLWWATSGKNMENRPEFFSQALGRFLTESVARDIAEMPTPNYKLAAQWMAEKPEDIEGLTQTMQGLAASGLKPMDVVRQALWGPGRTSVTPEGYLYGKDVTKSVLGTAFMTSAIGRTMGWLGRKPRTVTIPGEPGEPDEIINVLQRTATQPVPFQGELNSMIGMTDNPTISRTMRFFEYLTRQYGWKNKAGEDVFSPMPPEALSDLYNFSQELLGKGKEVPNLLRYILNQEGGLAANIAVQQAGASYVKEITDAQASSWMKRSGESLRIGSTTLPMYALDEGAIGLDPDIIRQRKTQFMAKTLFDIDPEALMSKQDREEKAYFTQKGTNVEANVVRGLAEQNKMFRYETRNGERVPVVGPIMGVDYEKSQSWYPVEKILTEEQLGQYPSLRSSSSAPQPQLHFAPDIFGPTFSDTGEITGIMQGSVKWSANRSRAQLKSSMPVNLLQEAQYSLAAMSAVRQPGLDPLRKLIEPLIRESSWFKESWGGESEAEQTRVINENLKVYRQALGGQPGGVAPNVRMFSYTGEQNNPELVSAIGGDPMNVTGSAFPLMIAQGAVGAQQAVSSPDAVRQAMIDIYGTAFELGTTGKLPTAFQGSNIPVQWRETSTKPSRLIQQVQQEGLRETFAFSKENQKNIALARQAGYSGNRPGEPLQAQPGGGGGEGGEPPERPTGLLFNDDPNQPGNINIRHIYSSPGQPPEKSIAQMRVALTDAEALLSMPEMVGFAGSAKIALAGIAGVNVEDIDSFDVDQLFLKARAKDPNATRQWMVANRRTIGALAATQSALFTGYAAIHRQNFSPTQEEGAALATILGRTPPQAATEIGAVITGLGPSENVGRLTRSLQAGSSLFEVTKDLQDWQGGDIKGTTEELSKFAKGLIEARTSMEKWQAVVDDSTKSNKDKEIAIRQIQREELIKGKIPLERMMLGAVQEQIEEGIKTEFVGMDPRNVHTLVSKSLQLSRSILTSEKQALSLEEEIENIETGKQKVPGGAGRFLRRALGGFGLMYLQSIAGFATSGMGYGQGERTQLDQILMSQGALGTGGALAYPNQMQALQNQIALAGATYNPMIGLQQMRANIPAVREATAFGQAALGTYAGLMWYGSFSQPGTFLSNLAGPGQPVSVLGRNVNLTAGKIAGAVGLVSLLGQAASSQADIEGVAQTMSEMNFGLPGFLKNISIQGAVGSLRYMTGDEELRQAYIQYSDLRQFMNEGGNLQQALSGMTVGGQTQALNRFTRLAIQRHSAFDPNVTAATAQAMYRMGISYDYATFQNLAAQQQAGIANEELITGMLGGLGYSAAQMYQQQPTAAIHGQQGATTMAGNVLLQLMRQPLSPATRASVTMGVGAIGQLGAGAYYMPGIGAGGGAQIAPEQMTNYYNQLGQLAVTPAFGLYQQQVANWYTAAQLGQQTTFPTMPSGVMSPTQLRGGQLTELGRAAQLAPLATYQETMQTAFAGMMTGPEVQAYAASRMAGLSRGEQVAEVERMQMAGEVRLMRERYGMGYSEVDMITRRGQSREATYREYGQLSRYGETKDVLTQMGVSRAEATAFASMLMGAEQRGPQGTYLAAQARGGMDTAAALGIDLEQFGKQMTSTIQNAVVGGMALGIAETGAGFGMNAENLFNYASQGFVQARKAGIGVSVGQRIASVTGQTFFAQRIADFTMQQSNLGAEFIGRLAQNEPVAMTMMAQAGQYPNMMATTNITMGGAVTGLPLFTSSMMQGNQNMGPQVFGPLANTRSGQVAQFGWNILTGQPVGQGGYAAQAQAIRNQGLDPNQFIVGGQRGLQWQAAQAGWDYQQAQAGIAFAQIALQEKWQPIFWGIQDRMTALQDRQAAWGFQMQGRQIEMQRSQFFENFGLNQKQSQMQRGWAMQDWAWQDEMRAMQWGWRQEDFAEQIRFTTGRERRMGERQMRRETILFEAEGDRTQTQRNRQKELWKLEDERFAVQRKQFMESLDLQEQNLAKQKQFYEEQTKLRDEMTEAQRQYWREQIELQKAAAGAAAGYAAEMEEIQKTSMLLGQAQEDFTDKAKVAMLSEVTMINTLVAGLNHVIRNAPSALMSIVEAMTGGSATYIPVFTISGGTSNSGGGTSGGGGGGGGAVPYSSPNWPTTVASSTTPNRKPINLTINIGGERLKTMVIEAVDQDLKL